MNEEFSTRQFYEWRRRENRWQIVFTLKKKLFWDSQFASVCVAMSMFKRVC